MNIKNKMIEQDLYSDDQEHNKYYSTVVEYIGYDKVLKILPFKWAEICRALAGGDVHLNTLRLPQWDSRITFVRRLLSNKGIGTSSISECVCILKECARMSTKTTTKESK